MLENNKITLKEKMINGGLIEGRRLSLLVFIVCFWFQCQEAQPDIVSHPPVFFCVKQGPAVVLDLFVKEFLFFLRKTLGVVVGKCLQPASEAVFERGGPVYPCNVGNFETLVVKDF